MKNVWEFLVKGGITMIPLFLCSIAGLAIVIEKFISLQRRKIIVPEVVSVLENIKGANDFPSGRFHLRKTPRTLRQHHPHYSGKP